MKSLIAIVLLISLGQISYADYGSNCSFEGAYECHNNGQDFYLNFAASNYTTQLRVLELGGCDLTAPLNGHSGFTTGVCEPGTTNVSYLGNSCYSYTAAFTYRAIFYKKPVEATLSSRVMYIGISNNSNSVNSTDHHSRPYLYVHGIYSYSNNTQDYFSVNCVPVKEIPSQASDLIFRDGFEGDNSGGQCGH